MHAGGERGSSHSAQTHKGGSHGHTESSAGSKALEDKVFNQQTGHGKGPKFMGGTGGRADEGAEHDEESPLPEQ